MRVFGQIASSVPLATFVTVDKYRATQFCTLHTLNVRHKRKKPLSDDNLHLDLKDKKQTPHRTKQQFGSPSLQASLRCQTLAFLPPHPLRK
jgi:hypothetical protein